MDADNRIEDDVLAPHEYALPHDALPIVEMALNHQEITFVLDAPTAVTFLTTSPGQNRSWTPNDDFPDDGATVIAEVSRLATPIARRLSGFFRGK